MTAEQHNKFVAWAHIANAGFYLLMMTFMILVFGIVLRAGPADPNAPPPAFFFAMFVMMAFFSLLVSLPSLFAAYGFWKKKSWARTMGIIAGVLAAMNAPIGTATCVYTFWFLFSDPGKQLYDKQQQNALPPPPPWWKAQELTPQDKEYVRRNPPDWR
jgi:hypothetical protein